VIQLVDRTSNSTLLWKASAACWCRTEKGKEVLCLADVDKAMSLVTLRMYPLEALLAHRSAWSAVDGLDVASWEPTTPPGPAATGSPTRRRSSLRRPPRPPPLVPSSTASGSAVPGAAGGDHEPSSRPASLPAKPMRDPPAVASATAPPKPNREPPALPEAGSHDAVPTLGSGLSLPFKLVLGSKLMPDHDRLWLREVPAAAGGSGDAFSVGLIGPEAQAILARCSSSDGHWNMLHLSEASRSTPTNVIGVAHASSSAPGSLHVLVDRAGEITLTRRVFSERNEENE